MTIDNSTDIFDALVLSRNHKAPIQDLTTIESELATKGILNGTILFDTFLSKTNATTRFIKATLNNGHFVKDSFETVRLSKKYPLKKHACKITANFKIII